MSQSPKLLNLDELADLGRSVRIKGEEYPIAERSLKDSIAAIKKAEALDKKMQSSEASATMMMNAMVDMAHAVLPSCPRDVIETLSYRQVNALVDFINASDSEVVENAEGKSSTQK